MTDEANGWLNIAADYERRLTTAEAEVERLKAELEAQRDSQISAVNGMLRAEQEIERLKAREAEGRCPSCFKGIECRRGGGCYRIYDDPRPKAPEPKP